MRHLSWRFFALTGVIAILSMVGMKPVAEANRVSGQQAIRFLNEQRVSHGLPGVEFSPELSRGCAAHDRYMAINGFGHGEKPGKKGYTPEGAGEGPYGGAEVLAWSGYGPGGQNPWENAPIHLYLMLDPLVTSAGYYEGRYACARMRSDYSREGAAKLYSYPGPGSTGVRSRQSASELPYIPQQLVGIPENKTTGPNILLFSEGAGRDLKATRFSISGPSGPVKSRLVVESTKNRIGSGFWFAGGGVLIPVDPLEPRAKYEVKINWINDDSEQFLQDFSFITRGLPPFARVSPRFQGGARFVSSSPGVVKVTAQRRHDGEVRTYTRQGAGLIRDKLQGGYWRYCWDQEAIGKYSGDKGCGAWRRYARNSGFNVTRASAGRFRIDAGAALGQPIQIEIRRLVRRCYTHPYLGRQCYKTWKFSRRFERRALDGIVPRVRLKRGTSVSFRLDRFDKEDVPFSSKMERFLRR